MSLRYETGENLLMLNNLLIFYQVNPTLEAVLKLNVKYEHMVEEHREPIYWCHLPVTMDPPTDRCANPICSILRHLI